MGTNYYLHEDVCPHCNRPGNIRHIGKSSAGWCFALHVYPDEGIRDLPDWGPKWSAPGSEIRDEYGYKIDPEDLLNTIERRMWPMVATIPNAKWYEQNHAVPGPKRLARHRIDGKYCIGHGAGTWDLHVGEFS